MSQKKTTTKGGTKGKAEGSLYDPLTAERIRNILEDPGVSRDTKERLECHINELYGATESDTLDECAGYYVLLFDTAHSDLRLGERKGKENVPARCILDRVVALAEADEPEPYRLARRISELLNSDADGTDEVVEWFMQLTNDAGVSLENPEFCAAAFVRAARRVEAAKPVRRATRANVFQRGAQKAYERLKEIVRRADAGESLAQIRDERTVGLKTSRAPREAKPKGKR